MLTVLFISLFILLSIINLLWGGGDWGGYLVVIQKKVLSAQSSFYVDMSFDRVLGMHAVLFSEWSPTSN